MFRAKVKMQIFPIDKLLYSAILIAVFPAALCLLFKAKISNVNDKIRR